MPLSSVSVLRFSDGESHPWRAGESLADALRRARHAPPLPCGGLGRCGQCAVRFVTKAPAPSDACRKFLTAAQREDGWRLACRMFAPVDAPVTATVDRDTLPSSAASWQVSTTLDGHDVVPDGRIRVVTLTPGVSTRALPRSLVERVLEAWPSASDEVVNTDSSSEDNPPREPAPARDAPFLSKNKEGAFGPPLRPRIAAEVYRALPGCFENNNTPNLDTVWRGRHWVAVHPARRTRPHGLAVDLGTTTLAALLVDLATGENRAVASRVNPQTVYGHDVMTRIERASARDADRRDMARLAIEAIDGLLAETCEAARVPPDDIYRAVVAGHTVMQHLLGGWDVRALGVSPFVPVDRRGARARAGDWGLTGCRADTPVHTLPSAGAFIGGDVVAGLLAHGFADRRADEGAGLFMDLGTNGEIVLAARGRLWAASAAAGPAFEGAGLRCGMGASSGAIDAVSVAPDGLGLRVGTIHDAPPLGLCGSGLLDALAVLLDTGVVDSTGRLLNREEFASVHPARAIAWRDRWVDDQSDDGPSFVLTDPVFDAPAGRRVVLTQGDIRQAQLAKGAMSAAARLLLEEAGIRADEVRDVRLAGGFGQGLRPASARRIGLLGSWAGEIGRAHV